MAIWAEGFAVFEQGILRTGVVQWRTAATPTIVVPAHAGIQYATASRFNRCRLWNTGSSGQAGR